MTDTPSALDHLQQRLGITFADEELLQRALVHRSYAFENGGLVPNERLEFLGDAVLGVVVTDEIFHLQADEAEGRLAKVRAAAVKTPSLAAVARSLALGEHVLLGKGEAASGGAAKDSILADTLEAVIGAYYLDRGFHAVYDLVQTLFAERLATLIESRAALDYKTSLQELSAARHGSLPVYEVSDVGPDHEKTFTALVRVGDEEVGRGQGRSKKQAEQRAAREAYRRLANEDRQLPDVSPLVAEGPAGTGGHGARPPTPSR